MIIDRRALLVGMAALAACPAGAQQPAPSQLDMRKMFDSFVNTVETRFYRKARLQEIGFRTKADALWPEVEGLASPAAAAPKLNALLSQLATSHTQVLTSDEPEFYILADVFGIPQTAPELWASPIVIAGIGIYTADFAGRTHIVKMLEGSPAERAGLKIGDEIVSVDGAPFRAVGSFRNKAGEHVRLAIRRRVEAAVETVLVPVVLMSPGQAFNSATQTSARVIAYKGRRIGYVHLWQIQNPDLMASALGKMDATRAGFHSANDYGPLGTIDGGPPLDALVVDNRTKVGGTGNTVRAFLKALDGEGQSAIRMGSAKRPPVLSLKSRAAMLIDEGTRSAAELLAYAFRQEGYGPLFGTRTAGAVSGGAAQQIAPGVLLYVAVSGVTINGVDLEGVGVEPTHRVERPIPYSAGADPVLEAALDHLAAT